MAIVVELDKNRNDALSIYVDNEGIDALILYLQELKKGPARSHNNLMTKAWAGNELSEEVQSEGRLIHKVDLIKTDRILPESGKNSLN